jgi:formylglycine-generating enzyme
LKTLFAKTKISGLVRDAERLVFSNCLCIIEWYKKLVERKEINNAMKTKLRFLFIGLALFAGVNSALAQLTNLGIAPAGNQTVLFWPTTLPNYILQSTTNLASPNWVTVSNSVPVNAVEVTNVFPASFFRLIRNTTSDGMAFIPAGSFTIGDTLDGESDAIPTNVYVSAFYMDTNLVSYSQWQSVYSYATSHGYGFINAYAGKAANHPVQRVDWFDAVKWCNARSQQAGLNPVYYTDAGLTLVYITGETTNVFANWMASGFRLPTEAEWERAARAGVDGQRFPWGNTISENQANYNSDTNYSYDLGPNGFNTNFNNGGFPYTSPAGYFAPNGYGLYDMAGNVIQWCWDWYGTPYAGGNDPRGPASGSIRVLRGGDWLDIASYSRCASRYHALPPNAINNAIGFRCVRGL